MVLLKLFMRAAGPAYSLGTMFPAYLNRETSALDAGSAVIKRRAAWLFYGVYCWRLVDLARWCTLLLGNEAFFMKAGP